MLIHNAYVIILMKDITKSFSLILDTQALDFIESMNSYMYSVLTCLKSADYKRQNRSIFVHQRITGAKDHIQYIWIIM